MSALSVDDISVLFPNRRGDFTAVDTVSLEINKGEILGLVGESGAGKSTVGAAIMGLIQKPGYLTGGTVGKRIGMIFQDPLTSLNPVETVGDQLCETMQEHIELTDAEALSRAEALLTDVGITEARIRLNHYPHQFSGGMRQRVVIALALCADPDVVVADEPTTALDVSVQAQVLALMKTMCKERNVAMVLITHDMGVIAETTDRVAVMYKGKIVEIGTTSQIISAPSHEYTKSLLSAVPPADRKIDRFPLVNYIEEDRSQVVNLDSHWLGQKREFDDYQGPILEVKNLSLDFLIENSWFKAKRKYLKAIDDVSFSIEQGKTYGIVGESGSGKSTTARVICGIYKPDSGQVNYAGTNLSALRSRSEAIPFRREMQMVFQDPYSSLNGRMRVGSIISEPMLLHKLAESKEQALDISRELLEVVGLDASDAAKYPHEFSGGQRQRISIARALATRPRLLICDEPTSALDVSIQAQILNLLKDIQQEIGLTMLFISHDLPVIRQMCDHICVMKTGKIVEERDAESMFTDPTHPYTKHLLSLMPKFSG